MAALLDLEFKAADVLNAREMIHTVLGPAFGGDHGKSVIIVKLYMVLTMQIIYLKHILYNMWELGYQSCDADAELWMKGENWLEDNLDYYSYSLHHVDDILCIHHDPDDVFN